MDDEADDFGAAGEAAAAAVPKVKPPVTPVMAGAVDVGAGAGA